MGIITSQKFVELRDKYGLHASWAIWAEETDRPKSNMGDLTIFEDAATLELLNPNNILVAYNFSVEGKVLRPWENFHGENGEAYKLRYALRDTSLWGAYITDIIKDLVDPDAESVTEYLRENPEVVRSNIERFEEEVKDLGVDSPDLYALGNDVFEILEAHLSSRFRIRKITHYAWQRSKEQYRQKILEQLRL